jgi:phosphinothricin acetyltransferase
MTTGDAERVLAIYAAGMAGGDATFETEVPTWAAFDAAHLSGHRFVATDAEGSVVGWVAVTPYSSRPVYRGVVEVSVYVRPDAQGRDVGTFLLDRLLASTDAAGVWTVQAGVFPENRASVALHQRAEFRVVGTRERLGQRDGRWRDVVLLERRSSPDSPTVR